MLRECICHLKVIQLKENEGLFNKTNCVSLEAYFYELRAYIYQARNLLSMDHDSLSGEILLRKIEKIVREEYPRSLCTTWFYQSKSTYRSDSKVSLSNLGSSNIILFIFFFCFNQ